MYVLRRYDYSIKRTFQFAAYTEVVKSCITELNGKKAVTIFLENPNSVKRARVMGWNDETEEYNLNLEKEYNILKKSKSKKKSKKNNKE